MTEPGKPTVKVPVITPAKVTSGKVTPETPRTEQVETGNNTGKTEKVSEIKKDTKRLANTGTTETNTGLAGLGLGILGGLLAAARRRKNDYQIWLSSKRSMLLNAYVTNQYNIEFIETLNFLY
ncbi:MAG: LPXTG cell wall anchor domain-containing protein [Gemella sp.]|nr:MAG: LPXTG cell wall anchor domain-containing protein [Gemella sp.]